MPTKDAKADDKCSDTHLTTALINHGITQAIKDLQGHEGKIKSFSRRLMADEVASFAGLTKVSPKYWRYNPQVFLNYLMEECVNTPNTAEFSSLFYSNFQTCKSVFDLSVVPLLETLPEELINRPFKQLLDHAQFPYLLSLYNMKCILETGVCLTAKPGRHELKREIKQYKGIWDIAKNDSCDFYFHSKYINGIEIWISSRLMAIKQGASHVWIGTREHFLMLSDTISQRWGCLIASMVAEIYGKDNYPSFDLLKGMFSWGDEMIEKFGNTGYRAIKMWEPLIIGNILASAPDPAVDNQEFLKTMYAGFLDAIPEHREILESYLERFQRLVEPHRESPHVLSQIFGLFRIWGHPTVDVPGGIRKLRSVACTRRMTLSHCVSSMHMKFRETFSISYFRKHGRWPNMKIPEHHSSYLLRQLELNQPINLKNNLYKKDDWLLITFDKTFGIPDKFELSEMIADKATSLGFYDLREAIRTKGTIGSSAERSVIIQWLKTNYNSPAEFLKEIAENGFSMDERVLGVREKEREMSDLPRLFGMLPIRKRLYVVLTEALLSSDLLPYFPEITMTLNQVKLREKMQIQTRKQSKHRRTDEATVVVNLDFMKWNSNMRKGETDPLFKDFDDLYGIANLFTRTHELFHPAQLYAANGVLIPDISEDGTKLENSEIVWDDHLGGIEGLRQKGWTIFTLCLLKGIADLHNVDCEIMGQGDNQVLVLTYHPQEEENVADLHKAFLTALSRQLAEIGPPLKLEETWSSSIFFIYGKYPILMGAPLSMSMKKICRVMRLTNDGFQNISSTLSSITANCMAAIESDFDPLVPFFLACFESASALRLHLKRPFFSPDPMTTPNDGVSYTVRVPVDGNSMPFQSYPSTTLRRDIEKLSHRFITTLMLYPSILGGYPVIQIWNTVVHGFPDPLTLAITGVRTAYHLTTDGELKKNLLHILNPAINPHVNPEMLCQDPVSLNLLHGSSPSDKVKRLVFDFLVGAQDSLIVNEPFKYFLKKARDSQKELCDLLYKMNPLHPKIASAILESTIVGRALKMAARITRTNVLISLFLQDRDKLESIGFDEDAIFNVLDEERRWTVKTFMKMFDQFERNFLNGMIYNLSKDDEPENVIMDGVKCSLEAAIRLRRDSWKRELEGVSVAVPWELFIREISYTANCEADMHSTSPQGYFLTTIIGRETLGGDTPTIGPFKAYIGSSTQNKVDYAGKELMNSSPPLLRGALRLLALPGWGTERDSGLSQLITKIIQSISNIPTDILVPRDSEIAGSLGHRWEDIKRGMTCTTSILWRFLTFITSSPNSFTPHVELDTDNLMLHYQSIYLALAYLESLKCYYYGVPYESLSLHYHVKCQGCIKPLNETKISLEVNEDTWNSIPCLVPDQNPYSWVEYESIKGITPRSGAIGSEVTNLSSLALEDQYRFLENMIAIEYVREVKLWDVALHQVRFAAGYSIPVNQVKRIDAKRLLIYLCYQMFLTRFWMYCRTPPEIGTESTTAWRNIIESCISIPTFWFEGLIGLFFNIEGLERWMGSAGVSPPSGNPPTTEAKRGYLHKCVRAIMTSGEFLNNLVIYLEWMIKKPLLIQRGVLNHPVYLMAVHDLLMGNADRMPSVTLRTLKTLEHHVEEDLILSNSNLIVHLELTNSHPLYIEVVSIWQKFLKVSTLQFIKTTPAAISQSLPSREYTPPTLSDPISTRDLLDLPITSVILLVSRRKSSCEAQPVVLAPLASLRGPIRWETHFYKPLSGDTTAGYKLMSILRGQIIGLDEWNEVLQLPFMCTGDGSGGFASICGRIIQQKYLMNSLYQLADMEAVGRDRVVPGALLSVQGLINRAVGLECMIEGISDLTKPRTITALHAACPLAGLITCDAEGGGWEKPEKGIQLAQSIVDLALKTKAKIVLLKTYVSNYSLVYTQVNILHQVFEKVSVIRSNFSSIMNTEVYLVGYKRSSHEFRPLKIRCLDDKIEMSDIYASMPLTTMRGKLTLPTENPLRSISIASPKYTRVVTTSSLSGAEKAQMEGFLKRLGVTSSYLFPQAMFSYLRSNYQLIKFSGKDPSHFAPTVLTRSVIHSIISDFLKCWTLHAFCSRVPVTSISNQLFQFLQSGALILFLNTQGGWSLMPRANISSKWTSAAYKIISLNLVPINKRKRMLVEQGELYYLLRRFKTNLTSGDTNCWSLWDSWLDSGRVDIPRLLAHDEPMSAAHYSLFMQRLLELSGLGDHPDPIPKRLVIGQIREESAQDRARKRRARSDPA